MKGMLYIPRGPGTSERDLMDPVLADPGIVEAVEVDWCLLGIHRNFLQQHRTNFFVMSESKQKKSFTNILSSEFLHMHWDLLPFSSLLFVIRRSSHALLSIPRIIADYILQIIALSRLRNCN